MFLMPYVLVVTVLSGCVINDGQERGSANSVFVIEKSEKMEEIQNQYPNWFDKEGKISYPYTLDSDEVKQAATFEERAKLVQIPEEIVDNVDTSVLLDAVERYPLLDFSLYDSFELGLKQLSEQFYGMEALLEREDGYKAAFLSFSERKEKEIEETEKITDIYALVTQIHIEEYLMLTKEAYEAMTEQQRQEVLDTLEALHTTIAEKEQDLPLSLSYGLEEMLEENDFWEFNI